ncbi:putative membrane protein [Cylindrospermum stagnale PCC 7417]|uniref:Putative membrane protein n=1 Tax=Cylindrospermum stagnale PCC 7417 TaxID=56107 RepID=K9WW61_9NOST|nr:DUF2157 domain-containing protein [Cylindrospermum stagnale]AFZ24453.1 putative membrane protein [Cylindrospermum stagnale PCC 7417]
MILDNFQRKLRQEAQLWRDEGLISSSQHQQLADRYQFNKLEAATRERFVFIVIGIGGILLGLGVITFVAANWQTWTREVKFILLMSLFLSTAITGFYTWREPTLAKAEAKKSQEGKRILGEALLILSAFILGANLLLMSQIFNVSGSTSELFLAWGLGVLVMAYGLSINSLGVLAIVLVQIGYWIGLRDLWNGSSELTWARFVVQHMPLLSWLLFVPLAYFCRSRWIFGMGAIAFATSLQLNLTPLPLLTSGDLAPWVAPFAFALPSALFWSYDDLLFPTINYRLFQPLARSLALVCFGIFFYLLSFRWQWLPLDYGYDSPTNFSNALRSAPIIDLGILSGLAVLQWLYLLRQRNNPPRREVVFTLAVITTFLAFLTVVPFWHQAISRIADLGIFIFNVLLGLLAWGLIQEGLKLRDRRSFWGGMLLFTLQIISRVLEYNTDLLFKSLVFILCGSALISSGLWFERRLSAASSSANKNIAK